MSKKQKINQEQVEKAIDAAMKGAHETEPTPVEIAKETMLGDLMKLCVENAKAMPRSWQAMSEKEQDDYLYRIEAQCRSAVQQCVQMIASEGFIRIPVQIKATTIKDTVVVQSELVQPTQVIDLVSAGTKIAMLVLADSGAFTRDEGKPEAEPDQRALGIGDEYRDDDGLTAADLIGGDS